MILVAISKMVGEGIRLETWKSVLVHCNTLHIISMFLTKVVGIEPTWKFPEAFRSPENTCSGSGSVSYIAKTLPFTG